MFGRKRNEPWPDHPRSARTTEKSTLSRAFLYILSEQNVYVHIKNLGKNRE